MGTFTLFFVTTFFFIFFLFVCLENVFHLIFFLVPRPVTALLDYVRSRYFGEHFRVFRGYKDEKSELSDDLITNNMDTIELCEYNGYECHEYITQTPDGFLLCLHRVRPKNHQNMDRTKLPGKNRPVFVMHGLMQSSECWVIEKTSLVYKLVDEGYDVWLGNQRSNRYSSKHVKLTPHDTQYWNHSLDEYAMYDVPTNINFILSH